MFRELVSTLPDGPVWLTGRHLKRLAACLDRDRARLRPGLGSESPSDDGRWLNFDTSSGASAGIFPLQLLLGSSATHIRVRRGSFNGVFSTGTDTTGNRFQMHIGDSPFIDIPVTAAGTIWAHLVIDVTLSQPITAFHLEVNPTSTVNTLTDIYKEIGSWLWDATHSRISGAPFSELTGSQDVAIGASTTDTAPVVQYSRI